MTRRKAKSAAPRKPRRATKRVPYGEDLVGLQNLILRLRSAEPVDRHDREYAALLLSMVAQDEDVRDVFYRTERGTQAKPPPKAYAAAFVALAAVRLKEEPKLQTAMSAVEAMSGLTEGQVDHAIRAHRYSVEQFMARLDDARLAVLKDMYARMCRGNSR